MKKLFFFFLCLVNYQAFANRIYIPMNANDQKNHLKAYGIAFNSLILNMPVEWLLNYDGGAFVCTEAESLKKLCILRDVSFKIISENEYQSIINTIAQPDFNGEVVKLDKAPHIAVYTPDSKLPWDDAVTMALTYADISYDKIYDKEIIEGKLGNYNWLHLHHEDFTGQYGKFWQAYQHADWYIADVKAQETLAKSLGFNKVSQLKLAVSKKIKDFVVNGGYLFAMCTATDSYDIALSAEGVDICEPPFDGDGTTPNAQGLLNYNNTFAFENYKIFTQPNFYEFSDIDNTLFRGNINPQIDYFSLFTFAAKVDLVPAMLTQNHTTMIKGFMGQTTAFQLNKIKSNVTILGSNDALKEAKYIHGNAGKGTFTFYGGHDPEDYQHAVGDPPTDLDVHPNSPGYRLILNNVLFPAAKKKPRKT